VVYQDRLETNLLQLFRHPETSDWFPIISVITFETNIVVEQKQAELVTIFFYKFALHPNLFLPLFRRPWLLYNNCTQEPTHELRMRIKYERKRSLFYVAVICTNTKVRTDAGMWSGYGQSA